MSQLVLAVILLSCHVLALLACSGLRVPVSELHPAAMAIAAVLGLCLRAQNLFTVE